MVKAVRQGQSVRAVARQFRVSPSTVSRWVKRASARRLDRCDFTDRRSGPPRPWNRLKPEVEAHVLGLRAQLRFESPLGEYGAQAIWRAWRERGGSRRRRRRCARSGASWRGAGRSMRAGACAGPPAAAGTVPARGRRSARRARQLRYHRGSQARRRSARARAHWTVPAWGLHGGAWAVER
jgi:transposase